MSRAFSSEKNALKNQTVQRTATGLGRVGGGPRKKKGGVAFIGKAAEKGAQKYYASDLIGIEKKPENAPCLEIIEKNDEEERHVREGEHTKAKGRNIFPSNINRGNLGGNRWVGLSRELPGGEGRPGKKKKKRHKKPQKKEADKKSK